MKKCNSGIYLQVREVNLYNEGDKTHYNKELTECNLRCCWSDVMKQANFTQLRKQTDLFNRWMLLISLIIR